MTDQKYMRLALKEAVCAYKNGEVPIGAIIVDCNGAVIGKGHNRIEELQDPTAHAELLALRKAAKKIRNWRLQGATLFCTMEPCTMCAGSLIQARIKRVVYATKDKKFGAAGSLYNILEDQRFNHQIKVESGLLKNESINLLKIFFSCLREKKKIQRKPRSVRGEVREWLNRAVSKTAVLEN